MAEFSRLVITNKGQALIAKIMTGKGNIVFTKVSASNAECVLEQLESLTELSDIRQTVPISKISRTNEVAITIESVFHNLEMTEGYHMRALGLYATDPDEGEILYAVTMEISGNCYMPAYNGIAVSEAYIKLVTTVGNSESVSLEVDLAAVVTVGDMNSLRKEIKETYLEKTGDSSETTVEFEVASERKAFQSGEKHKTILGKIAKWLKDLHDVAFSGSYYDLENQPTAETFGLGKVNNTSDMDKPVSKAQQTALDKKVNFTDITRSTAVNIAGKKALDAMEKNPSVDGTLAHDISQIYSNLENFDANSVGKCYFKKVVTQVPSTAEETLIATLHTDWYCPAIIGTLMRRPDGTGYNTISASNISFRVTTNFIYAEFTGNSWWHGTELILYLTVGALNG